MSPFVYAFAQATDLEQPADFDEAAWQAERDANDTDGDGDGYIGREESEAAPFRWYGKQAVAQSRQVGLAAGSGDRDAGPTPFPAGSLLSGVIAGKVSIADGLHQPVSVGFARQAPSPTFGAVPL